MRDFFPAYVFWISTQVNKLELDLDTDEKPSFHCMFDNVCRVCLSQPVVPVKGSGAGQGVSATTLTRASNPGPRPRAPHAGLDMYSAKQEMAEVAVLLGAHLIRVNFT